MTSLEGDVECRDGGHMEVTLRNEGEVEGHSRKRKSMCINVQEPRHIHGLENPAWRRKQDKKIQRGQVGPLPLAFPKGSKKPA